MFASSVGKGALKVLDFGGSLETSYYQNKFFLDKLDDVSWSIVEQKHFVDTGKKYFEDDKLKFFYDVSECIRQENPNVLLLSSVLMYIEKPYELLDTLLEYDFKYILIDKTQFSKSNERITLQIVPPSIYKGSYPCRSFKEATLKEYFIKHQYSILEDFHSYDDHDEFEFKGMIIEKATNQNE